MKRKVKMEPYSGFRLAIECPRCSSDDLCIDNNEGLECMSCGCWFDTDQSGNVLWARDSRPADLD